MLSVRLAERMVDLVIAQAESVGKRHENERLNMESKFSQAALDIIGISVSTTTSTPSTPPRP